MCKNLWKSSRSHLRFVCEYGRANVASTTRPSSWPLLLARIPTASASRTQRHMGTRNLPFQLVWTPKTPGLSFVMSVCDGYDGEEPIFFQVVPCPLSLKARFPLCLDLTDLCFVGRHHSVVLVDLSRSNLEAIASFHRVWKTSDR